MCLIMYIFVIFSIDIDTFATEAIFLCSRVFKAAFTVATPSFKQSNL